MLRAVAGVVVTSEWTRRQVLTRYAIPACRVYVARPGVDRVAAPARPVRGHLICIGVLGRHKGQDPLVEALADLVTFGEFGVESAAVCPGLPSLFTAARITWGNPVRLEIFARANIVAFERNGFGPVSVGGFESCDWLISGGGASVAIPWDGRIGVGRADHILASGNILGADPVSPGDALTKDSFT